MYRCVGVVPIWDKYWNSMLAKKAASLRLNPSGWLSPRRLGNLSVLSTMSYAFGPAYALSALYQLGYSVLQFASPQIVNLLIDFVESDEPNWKGYFYTVLIVCTTFVCTVLNSQCFYQEYLVGLRVRTALTSAIYRKSVKLSNTGRKEMTGKNTIPIVIFYLTTFFFQLEKQPT